MSRRTRHGLTMLEIIVSLVLVSTILLVSLSASGDLMRNTADSYAAMDSREVIGVFLDEISALDFQDRDEPSHYGPESGEIGTNRTNLEDVDDFFDFSSTPPKYRNGDDIPGFAGWTISATVLPAEYSSSGVSFTTELSAPYRVIIVSCTSPNGSSQAQSTLVSNIPSSLSDDQSMEQVRRIRMEFSTDRVINVVVPLRNSPSMASY